MNAVQNFTIATNRQAVSAFADTFAAWAGERGIPESSVRAFQVVFDELLTNAIDYGLADTADGQLQVSLCPSVEALEAVIVDNGPAFDPLLEAESPDLDLSLEHRPIGGLGIHLVKSLMDHAEYRRSDDRNVLRLSKRHAG